MKIPLRLPSAREISWARKIIKGKTTFKSEEPSQKKLFLNTVRARRILNVDKLSKQGSTLSLDIQAFRLSNNTAIVTLPGEMFVEQGLTIKNLSPFDNTMVVELANVGCGYVPNRKAYLQEGYEIEQARLAPGGAEIMVQALVDMLRELKTDVS